MAADVIDRIVESALEIEVRACRRPTSGSVADTYCLELAGPPRRAVCKLGGASVWTDDVIEPLVTDLVGRATELPVPDVLASGSLEPPVDGLERWALYEFREGTTPSTRYVALEPAVRRRLVADAGAALGRLHAVHSFDRVGGLARDGDRLRLREPDDWHALDPGPVLEHLSILPTGDGGRRLVLTHGDFQPGNLLVDDRGRVKTVLDWGNAHVAPAEYALARAEVRFVDRYGAPTGRRLSPAEQRRLRRTFRTGYARHAPLEDDFGTRVRRHKLCWLLQSVANYARVVQDPRGRRQVARQCRRLVR